MAWYRCGGGSGKDRPIYKTLKIHSGKISNTTGEVVEDNTFYYTDYFPCPNGEFTFDMGYTSRSETYAGVTMYKKDKSYTSDWYWNPTERYRNKDVSSYFSQGARFLRFSFPADKFHYIMLHDWVNGIMYSTEEVVRITDKESHDIDLIPNPATSESTEPFANSEYAAELAVWKAFDKSKSTFWASANSNGDKYIGWKFSSAVAVNKVYMAIGSNDGWETRQAPNTWFVEGSNDDGTTWTVVNYNEHSWTTAYEEIEYEFLNETAYKWWRIRITRTMDGTSGCASLAELDFYNVCNSYQLGTKTITENGTYSAKDDGVDGYSEVTVNVISYKNYIKFNGEGIMLPWSINSDYKIEVTFHETTYYNDSAIIGNSIGPSDMHLTEYNNKYYFLKSRNGETNYGTWSAGEHTFIYNNGSGKNTLDGTVVSNFTPYNYSSALYSIGCRGGIKSNVYNGWIKSYKIYSISQDELIHDLRPAIVAGYPCFIDVISNAIYSNGSIQAVDTIT